MDKRGTIRKFEREHYFLSNFFPHPVQMDSDTYPSVEHAYQAAKTSDRHSRVKIRIAQSASIAKRLGRKVQIIDDWEEVKIEVMKLLVSRKFRNPVLAEKLKATGDMLLVEGNWWHDTFWGVCNGIGENHLGKILMEVRNEWQNEV